MLITSPALRATEISSVLQGLSGLCREDQAAERQKGREWSVTAAEKQVQQCSGKVPKGGRNAAQERSHGNCSQRRGSTEETAGESRVESVYTGAYTLQGDQGDGDVRHRRTN